MTHPAHLPGTAEPARRALRARRGVVALALLVGAVAVVGLTGCRSTKKQPRPDPQVQRLASDAREAFALGVDATALARYRQALKRAWALDDPVEVANSAYNLAACLLSVGRYDEARGWLAECRVELARTGRHSGAAWMLEAKLARQEGRLGEAEYISRAIAARVRPGARPEDCPPLGGIPVAPPEARCGDMLDDEPTRLARLQEKLSAKEACADRIECQTADRQARRAVWIFEANLACDRGDLAAARAALDRAQRHERAVTQLDWAEIDRVSGRIALLAFAPAEAGRHFDREAERCRRAGHAREVAFAFYDAGEAYESAGMPPLAVDRYLRTARMLYARGAWVDALLVIELCLPLVEQLGDADLAGRLGVLFREVSAEAEQHAKKSERKRGADHAAAVPGGPASELPSPASHMPSSEGPAWAVPEPDALPETLPEGGLRSGPRHDLPPGEEEPLPTPESWQEGWLPDAPGQSPGMEGDASGAAAEGATTSPQLAPPTQSTTSNPLRMMRPASDRWRSRRGEPLPAIAAPPAASEATSESASTSLEGLAAPSPSTSSTSSSSTSSAGAGAVPGATRFPSSATAVGPARPVVQPVPGQPGFVIPESPPAPNVSRPPAGDGPRLDPAQARGALPGTLPAAVTALRQRVFSNPATAEGATPLRTRVAEALRNDAPRRR